jgi:hypothetical protein
MSAARENGRRVLGLKNGGQRIFDINKRLTRRVRKKMAGSWTPT